MRNGTVRCNAVTSFTLFSERYAHVGWIQTCVADKLVGVLGVRATDGTSTACYPYLCYHSTETAE